MANSRLILDRFALPAPAASYCRVGANGNLDAAAPHFSDGAAA